MEDDTATKRATGLTKLFNAVIFSRRELKSTADGNRFLEALCAQQDVSKCVENVIAAPGGLSAVAKAFRFSKDTAFLNGPAASALLYLSDASLKQLYGGQFLHLVLEQIVQPPSFWKSLVEAHQARILTDQATHAFAWLLLELLCSRLEHVPDDIRNIAERITNHGFFTNSSLLEVRNLGHRIKHVLDSTSPDASQDGPGGRHDNDFADYRKIKILPTADEFASTERPFYRKADAIESTKTEDRGLIHLDNQFRLLREDLLGELRDDYQIAIGAKKGRRKAVLTGLQFAGINCGIIRKRKPCSVELRCTEGIPQMKNLKEIAIRKQYVVNNKNFLKHQSFGCLVSHGDIMAFATVDRDEDKLAQKPPVLVLRISDQGSLKHVLLASKFSLGFDFVQVDTAVFAYEPVLKCLQSMTEVPLQEQLLDLSAGSSEVLSGIQPTQIFNAIDQNWGCDFKDILGTTRSVNLDAAQAKSLLTGISKKVSLIQGPPGTGKSFIGALIAKILHDHTSATILVQTYTNHALDQYLGELLDIGIPPDSIGRLGNKPTGRAKALSIFDQPNTYRKSGQTHHMLQDQNLQSEIYRDTLAGKVVQFEKSRLTNQVLLDYLEFSEDSEFFDAFAVPDAEDGMSYVGKNGKSISKYYLLDQWILGHRAGMFQDSAERDYPYVWSLEPNARAALKTRWMKEIVEEQVSEIINLAQNYDKCRQRVDQLNRQKLVHLLGQKRIIACTTTAAAKYTEELQKASPQVVIVEEAGEILESHTLAAMTTNTKQLVLIGDHKQLRPKVSKYPLTVEYGDGYNLNQSLFERLVLAGVPHTTLNRQHRMRPEISALVRSLTYPELNDAPATERRPALRGFRNNVIFVSHHQPELNANLIADRRDEGAKSSKENEYEVGMVLKCVRYLGQQGYGTDDIVILTPYLGQLYLLSKTLSKDNDPILNDLDSFELIRAGLLTPPPEGISTRRIRISTIDNYQGEESDIVIASLTRSNDQGDIGFMAAPQRVNVLLSRARNALIMLGNAETFMNSRKGKEVWVPLIDQLKRQGHVYDGFPVQCEQHPDKKALLVTKDAFDTICPDGGCSEPCGKVLRCDHKCPRRCHQLQDHSQMKCGALVTTTCSRGHKISRVCHDKAATACKTCEAEAQLKEKKERRDHDLDRERQAKQRAYARQLAELNDEIEHQKRLLKNHTEDRDFRNTLAQRRKDLSKLKEKAQTSHQTTELASITPTFSVPTQPKGSHSADSSTPTQPSNTSDPGDEGGNSGTSDNFSKPDLNMSDWDKSEAKDDWEWQKQVEGADNEALDALVSMIGLESVKQKFLAIKAKVDTVVRQDASLKDERFGAALLGNPGTGKTTVARLYAKFLMKVGALPGDYFFENSGSSLASDGVPACKAHIDKILEQGGGVFFIDEAYQLVSGNSPGGKAVVDFLLAEIENLTGKIVFVLAGYHKQMEAFFSHNPGIPSRIPIQMEFQDYDDKELHRIFCSYIKSKYKECMSIEDGMRGLYARIVVRRIGRGRGREGFGNARQVQNCVSQITERQAKRLKKERRAGLGPDDHFLTKEDLIGPEPSAVLKNNAAWHRLQKLIGLKSVKESIQVLLDGIQFNYQRELQEKPLVEYSLNKCFIGSPGTGKTSVAKLYGRILADIGLLSNGEVVVKNPADFIADVIGGSETKTKAILASTIGKVLIIDEAYMLAGGGGGGNADSFKTAVIDTIVAEVQSYPGEDRCVLLLGYKVQMEEMFRDVNPGLARRFPLDSSFIFEDFSDPELRRILDLKLKDVGFDATDQAKNVAMENLQRARNRPNFGNAGEVDILLDRAKGLHQKHLTAGKAKHPDTFEAIDFDPDFNRGERAATNLPQLFQDVVGCEKLIQQFQGYQTTAANLKALGMDPRNQIPFNFLFKGPPGTGKTTTAQKMGKIFYDMGFLAHAKVEECSATDLVGQYVGHTGPKVQKLLEKALGKVLFVDEAYRLAEGHFATVAMDELVDCLTKPKFAQKLIVILAGYDKDIDRLMSMNPGLTSRFPETVIFEHLPAETCFELLTKVLQKKAKDAPLEMSVLTSPDADFKRRAIALFQGLLQLEAWGNGRDVKRLAKDMFGKLISMATPPITSLILTEDVVIQAIEAMLSERSRRSKAVGTTRFPSRPPLLPNSQTQQKTPEEISPRTYTGTATNTTSKSATKGASPPSNDDPGVKTRLPQPTEKVDISEEPVDSIRKAKRDPSVSDAVWEQLERDKKAELAREQQYRRLQEEKHKEEERIEALQRAEKAAKDDEERRAREQQRICAELERRRHEAILVEIEKQNEKERMAQKKLKELGRCPMGYRWIKQGGGYRCAGGSHFMSDTDLGL